MEILLLVTFWSATKLQKEHIIIHKQKSLSIPSKLINSFHIIPFSVTPIQAYHSCSLQASIHAQTHAASCSSMTCMPQYA